MPDGVFHVELAMIGSSEMEISMSDRTITMVHDGNARPAQDLMRHDAKSLALFVAIQKKLANAPDRQARLQSALDWAVRFAKERTEDAWLAAWVEVLERAMESPEGLEDLYRLMLDTGEYAITMRSSSPFAGVLTTRERTEVLLAFQRDWPPTGGPHDGRAA